MLKANFLKTISAVLILYAVVLFGAVMITGANALLNFLECTETTTGKVTGYAQSEFEEICGKDGTLPVVSFTAAKKDHEYTLRYPQYFGDPIDGINVSVRFKESDPSNAYITMELIFAGILSLMRIVVMAIAYKCGQTLRTKALAITAAVRGASL